GPEPRPRTGRAGGAPADDRGAARRAGARRDQLRPGMATGGDGRDVRAGVHHDGRTSHAETPLTGDAMPLDPTKAVHTWSLFRTMGRFAAPGSAPSGLLTENPSTDGLDLLELPGQLAAHGFASAQLCHFYLPRTDASYLAELRDAFATAEVDLECFLVDDGDIIHPARGAEQQRWRPALLLRAALRMD